jgi:hypothetical protein
MKITGLSFPEKTNVVMLLETDESEISGICRNQRWTYIEIKTFGPN